MHELMKSGDWEIEAIRDDYDTILKILSLLDPATAKNILQVVKIPQTMEEQLEGCTFLKMRRTSENYLAMIRFDETEHNASFYVGANVFWNRGKFHEYTENDGIYTRRLTIEGTRGQAAEYALRVQIQIDNRFFR